MVHGLLIAVACCRAQALGAWASVVAEPGLRCPIACIIFPE